jgi:hypothetical protein
MSREDIIRQIVERETQTCGLTEEVVQHEAPELYQSACDHFGTWDTALQYAGVNLYDLYAARHYSREQVIQEIRKCCRKSFKPTAMAVQKQNYWLYKAARKYFGDWRHALAAAGVDIFHAGFFHVSRRLPSTEQLANALRAWRADGHSLRWNDICLQNFALASAAKRRFRSWRRALAAIDENANSQLPKLKRKWSRQRIIECVLQRQREDKSLNSKVIRREDGALLGAARRYFGGWNQTLAAAGIAADVAPTPCSRRLKQ